MRRRSLLATLASGSLAPLAGCLDALTRASATPDLRAPATAAVDDRLDLGVTDARSRDRLVVEATTEDAGGHGWRSRATFDPAGETLALADVTPVEGTYDAADGMGLCWSMRPDDPTRPVYDDDQRTQSLTLRVRAVASDDGAPGDTLAETTVERRLAHPESTETDVADPVVGTLVESPGEGPAPGVLLLHGSAGDRTLGQARALAAHGFTVLALQYFSPERPALPDALVEVPVEYGDRAVAWLASHEATTDAPVRVGGVSRGGELALLLASRNEVGAVVNWAGAGRLFNGFDETGPVDAAAWSLDGEPLAHPPLSALERGGTLTERYRRWLTETPRATLDAAEVPLAEVDAPVLLLSAGADGVWPSRFLLDRAADRLDALDDPPPHEHHSYDRSGHGIGVPFLPTWGNQPDGPLGGTLAGTAAAERDSWPRVVAWLGGDGG
jgi:nucleolar protein 56